MRKPKSPKRSQADELMEIRIAIEKAKLAKLQADLPKAQPGYIRYEDLPPLCLEDQARLKAELFDLFNSVKKGDSLPFDDPSNRGRAT